MGCWKSIHTCAHRQENDGRKGRTIYVENLPANVPPHRVGRVLSRFGKIGGGKIRVINQGVNAYAFVQFEDRISVLKAVKASPLRIHGRRIFIEEKWWSPEDKPAPSSA